MADKKDLSYEITEHLGVLGEENSGWIKEVNMMKWGSAKEPKIDIRSWHRGNDKMGKGITLNDQEAKDLIELLQTRV